MVSAELQSRIEHAVSWVLNPLSHSQSVDRYRSEIEDAIYAIDDLEQAVRVALQASKTVPVRLWHLLVTVLQASVTGRLR